MTINSLVTIRNTLQNRKGFIRNTKLDKVLAIHLDSLINQLNSEKNWIEKDLGRNKVS